MPVVNKIPKEWQVKKMEFFASNAIFIALLSRTARGALQSRSGIASGLIPPAWPI